MMVLVDLGVSEIIAVTVLHAVTVVYAGRDCQHSRHSQPVYKTVMTRVTVTAYKIVTAAGMRGRDDGAGGPGRVGALSLSLTVTVFYGRDCLICAALTVLYVSVTVLYVLQEYEGGMMVLIDLGVSAIFLYVSGHDCIICAVTVLYVQNLAVPVLHMPQDCLI